jgi:hypothetical protein
MALAWYYTLVRTSRCRAWQLRTSDGKPRVTVTNSYTQYSVPRQMHLAPSYIDHELAPNPGMPGYKPHTCSLSPHRREFECIGLRSRSPNPPHQLTRGFAWSPGGNRHSAISYSGCTWASRDQRHAPHLSSSVRGTPLPPAGSVTLRCSRVQLGRPFSCGGPTWKIRAAARAIPTALSLSISYPLSLPSFPPPTFWSGGV